MPRKRLSGGKIWGGRHQRGGSWKAVTTFRTVGLRGGRHLNGGETKEENFKKPLGGGLRGLLGFSGGKLTRGVAWAQVCVYVAGASEASPGHIYKDLPKGLRAVGD